MRKYTIAIVENDEDEQLFMKEAFDTVGLFSVVGQLESGNDLADWLRENSAQLPDLILTDLNMPGKNGYDIIEMVASNPDYAHIPVIVTSTSSTQTIIDKCLDLGAADYLIKPDTFVQYIPYVEHLYSRIQEKQLVR